MMVDTGGLVEGTGGAASPAPNGKQTPGEPEGLEEQGVDDGPTTLMVSNGKKLDAPPSEPYAVMGGWWTARVTGQVGLVACACRPQNLTPFDTDWKNGSGATPLTIQDL